MDEPVCPGCRELSRQVAELTAQVAELTRKLDEATRAAKRQAAPFRKGRPSPTRRSPGASPVAFLVRNAQRHTGRRAYMSLWLLAEMGPKAAAALPALQDLANNRTEWDAEYVRGAAEQAIAAINSGT